MLRTSLLHHPLRYKHQLLMALVEVGAYFAYALPHQLAAIELFNVRPWVQPACKAIDSTVLAMVPTVDKRGLSHLCDSEQTAAPQVLVFCYVAIALLFSINFIYWEVGGLHGLLSRWLSAGLII